MSKTLVAILHHNSIQYTDSLYEMLKPYERDDYELIVIDNGSDPGKSSKYNTHKIDVNTGYGGGLDIIINHFLSLDPETYDSLSVLNSDLTIHGYNYFRTLREELFKDDDLVIVSPCLIQNGIETDWKHMRCWNSDGLRYVEMLDFQAPLMKRKFVETAKQFGSKYGWVQDIITGIICKDNNWKIAISDRHPVFHVVNGTVKDNPNLSNYNILAHQEMDIYFLERGLTEIANEMKLKSKQYTYEKI
jgi:hypothetical protein